jgi:hypothetical protein
MKITLIFSPYKPELSMLRSCPNRLEFKNECYSDTGSLGGKGFECVARGLSLPPGVPCAVVRIMWPSWNCPSGLGPLRVYFSQQGPYPLTSFPLGKGPGHPSGVPDTLPNKRQVSDLQFTLPSAAAPGFRPNVIPRYTGYGPCWEK